MKKLIIAVIIGAALFTASLFLFSCSAGSKWCKPENIQSGRSSQHHDSKKMRAGIIRVRWIHRDGDIYHVRYENMQTSINRVYFRELPSPIIQEGKWIPTDSLCAFDERAGNI